MAPWAPAAAKSASRFCRAAASSGSGGSLATTWKREENRRSFPMISGSTRPKLPWSAGVTRVNSGMAMLNFFEPLWVALRKTSTPCEDAGGVTTPTGTSSIPRTTARTSVKARTTFTTSPLLLRLVLEPEVHAERPSREALRQRRERARLEDRPHRGLVVDGVAGAPLDARLLDLALPVDLEEDDRLLPADRGAPRRHPLLGDLVLELPQVVGEREVAHVERDVARRRRVAVRPPRLHQRFRARLHRRHRRRRRWRRHGSRHRPRWLRLRRVDGAGRRRSRRHRDRLRLRQGRPVARDHLALRPLRQVQRPLGRRAGLGDLRQLRRKLRRLLRRLLDPGWRRRCL